MRESEKSDQDSGDLVKTPVNRLCWLMKLQNSTFSLPTTTLDMKPETPACSEFDGTTGKSYSDSEKNVLGIIIKFIRNNRES